jgi:hypothetical protein
MIPIGVRLFLLISPRHKHSLPKPSYSFGKLAIPLYLTSFLWLLFTTVLMFLPYATDPDLGTTVDNFNYTPIFFGFWIIVGLFFCLTGDYKQFSGPNVHIGNFQIE